MLFHRLNPFPELHVGAQRSHPHRLQAAPLSRAEQLIANRTGSGSEVSTGPGLWGGSEGPARGRGSICGVVVTDPRGEGVLVALPLERDV